VTHAEGLDFAADDRRGRDPLETVLSSLPAAGRAPFVLILVAERFDRRRRAYRVLSDKGVVVGVAPQSPQRLQARLEEEGRNLGIRVESGVAQVVWNRLGGSEPARLRHALDQLLLDAGPGGSVTVKRAEAVVPMDREAAIWAISDAIAGGDALRALGVLGLLIEQGHDALAINGFLASHYRALAKVAVLCRAGAARDEVIRASGLHPFRAAKMIDEIESARPGRLERALLAIDEADAILKSSSQGDGKATPGRWLEQLVLALIRGTRLRRPRGALPVV
jgi:DNA polymerase III delta subunit